MRKRPLWRFRSGECRMVGRFESLSEKFRFRYGEFIDFKPFNHLGSVELFFDEPLHRHVALLEARIVRHAFADARQIVVPIDAKKLVAVKMVQ